MIRDADDMIPGEGHEDETVGRRAAALSTLLTSLDPADDEVAASAAAIRTALAASSRTAWYRSPKLLRAAATIAVVFGTVAVVPPARAWVVDRARAAAAVLGGSAASPDGPGTRPAVDAAPPADAAAVYSFTVPGDVFEVDARGVSGVLFLSGGAGLLATAEATGAGIVVLPGALRIEASSFQPVTARLLLPGHVTTVRVRLDGEITREVELPEGGEVSVRLDAPA